MPSSRSKAAVPAATRPSRRRGAVSESAAAESTASAATESAVPAPQPEPAAPAGDAPAARKSARKPARTKPAKPAAAAAAADAAPAEAVPPEPAAAAEPAGSRSASRRRAVSKRQTEAGAGVSDASPAVVAEPAPEAAPAEAASPSPEAAADAPARPPRKRSRGGRRSRAAAHGAGDASLDAGGEAQPEPADDHAAAAEADAPEPGAAASQPVEHDDEPPQAAEDEVAAEPPPPEPPPPPRRVRRALDPAVGVEAVGWARYAVRVPGEPDATVEWRGSEEADAACTCLDHALAEDGACPHVHALQDWLDVDDARQPVTPVTSRVALRRVARASLQWLPGRECLPALQSLAQAALADPADAAALPRLLRAAREAGHGLRVDDEVWRWQAQSRDAAWRVQRLEALLPDGPHAAELQALSPGLLPVQWEGALFAVCAGRCLLADAPELQPWAQAVAAVALWRAHFGVQRVLVLAPSEALDRWRRALPDGADGIALMDLARVADDTALHRELAPELVVVHEPEAGGLWVDAERAAAMLDLPAPLALVLPAPGWDDARTERVAELPLRVAFIDAGRHGAYADLLQRHGQRDADGALCGLQALDELPDTLAGMLLARPLASVRSQLPERVDRALAVPVPAGHLPSPPAALAECRAQLQQGLASGWWSDAQLLALRGSLQRLRRHAAGGGQPGIAAAKAAALRAWLDDADAPVAQAVVFSQWPDALDALAAALGDLPLAHWRADDPQARRDAELARFRSDARCRLLLVADEGSGALDVRVPGAAVVQLDLPWNPRQAARRFGRVHRRGKACLVPAPTLVLDGSIEAALQALAGERTEPVTEWLDANAAQGFVQGDEQSAWLADLQRVLAAV